MALPRQEWTWTHPDGTAGVHTYQGHLLWWDRPKGPNGRFGEVATTQSFSDYRARGPKVGGAPDDVLAELDALLGRRG